MPRYDVCLTSLSFNGNTITRRWIRGMLASSIQDASAKAIRSYPRLGLTPTTVSSIYTVWPDKKK